MVCGLSRRQNVKKQFCLSAVSPAVNFFDRLSEAPEMKCAVLVFPSRQYVNLPALRSPFWWAVPFQAVPSCLTYQNFFCSARGGIDPPLLLGAACRLEAALLS